MRNAVRGRVAACLVAGLLALSCGGGDDTGRGEGIVRAVDPVTNRVTLDHGDIPGLMKAMRMDFEVSDPSLLAGLRPGDEIRFAVREANGRYTLTEVAKMQEEPAQ